MFFLDGHIIFEYTIPRIGNRVDNIVIYKGIIFLLEFKVGEKKYPSYAIEQVTDYAFDLSCFHKESHNRLLVPILISTKAHSAKQEIRISKDNVLETIRNDLLQRIRNCQIHNRSFFKIYSG